MEKYENSQEIMERIDALITKKEQYVLEISLTKKRKAENNNRKSKKYCNDIIKAYKNSIKELDVELEKRYEVLTKLTSFELDELLPFLTECISVKEQRPFLASKIVLNFSMGLSEFYTPNFINYFLVFDAEYEEEEQQLERTFLAAHMINYYEEILGDSKKVLSQIYPDISLLINNKLNSAFADFPYLEEIAFNLIDRRLREPDKSKKEILNDELEEIKNLGTKLKKD